jgi:hypothetical protein
VLELASFTRASASASHYVSERGDGSGPSFLPLYPHMSTSSFLFITASRAHGERTDLLLLDVQVLILHGESSLTSCTP